MILSIGHGAVKSADELLALLKQHEVTLLVDVRTKPYSRWQPDFNRPALAARLGKKYVWMGEVLGGLGPPIEKSAIDRLVRIGENERVAVMCSEAHPSKCHRHSTIAKRLLERGIEVLHILKDGSILTSTEMEGGTPDKKPASSTDKARAKQSKRAVQQKLF